MADVEKIKSSTNNDNDERQRSSKSTLNFLKKSKLMVLQWPLQSPDRNVIEYL